jgi:hypothetical protein
VLVADEVGYLTYGTDAAKILSHVVNERHRPKRPIIFTTNKPPAAWGKELRDEDLAPSDHLDGDLPAEAVDGEGPWARDQARHRLQRHQAPAGGPDVEEAQGRGTRRAVWHAAVAGSGGKGSPGEGLQKLRPRAYS